MSETAQIRLDSLRNHNIATAKGDTPLMKKEEVMEAYVENMGGFAKELSELRLGKKVDKYNRPIAAKNVSFAAAISEYFGIKAPDRDENGQYMSSKQRQLFVIKKFLKQNDVYFGSDTLETMAQRFGIEGLNATSVNNMLTHHSQFDGVNNTSQVPGDFRFLIPELIMAAIRLDYEGSMVSNNWIANTISITQREAVMPFIKRGNTNIRRIGESESIPFGTVAFGSKKATVNKVGTGFKITDELVQSSSLDMLFEFIGQVGVDMAIGADVEAFNVLMNGEQISGDESAGVIGVDNGTTIQFKDLKRAIMRMTRLKRNVTHIITSETSGVELSLLDEFKGFSGDKTLMNLQQLLGIPATLINDVFAMPDKQVILLAPEQAMVKLQYRSMLSEQRRNPQNQELETFVSDHVGFAIKRRDARLVIDSSMDFASNGFPDFMDVDARISQSFKTVDQL